MPIFKRFAAKPAVLLLAALVVSACSSINEERRGYDLTTTLRTYSKLLRWGQFEDAAQYIRNPDDEEIPVDLGSYGGVKITDFDNISEGMSDDGLEARISSVIAYYRQDTGVLREIRYEQVWWYDALSKRWFLDGPLPDLR